MIAKAIGPQNTVGAIGINPRTVEIAVSMIGRKRERVAPTTASQILQPLRPFGLDLLDEDHRIAGDHAEQRQNAEDRDKAERLAKDEQRDNDADEAHWDDAHNQKQAAEAVQLSHQEDDHEEEHQGNHREDRGLRLCAFLDRTAHFDAISFWKVFTQLRDRRG